MFRVNFPLLKGAFLSGFLIIFIDISKELPATLLLRPFNFDTLATRIYELASNEMLPIIPKYFKKWTSYKVSEILFLEFYYLSIIFNK
jgi:ABC-type spermidine/putrescine transport system permease subunit II